MTTRRKRRFRQRRQSDVHGQRRLCRSGKAPGRPLPQSGRWNIPHLRERELRDKLVKVCAGDFDNDGLTDLFVTYFDNVLYAISAQAGLRM
jgi:hypothetical protein